jgi:hypothetical protein
LHLLDDFEMNLMLGVVVIGAAAFFLRFLAALRKEEKVLASPRPVKVYVADGGIAGVHRITGRRYGGLMVMDGGAAARMLARPPVEAWSAFPVHRPGFREGALRQR